MKVQGKLNMHIISESVLMMLTENYHNWSMLVEATACQIWLVFEIQCRVWEYLYVVKHSVYTISVFHLFGAVIIFQRINPVLNNTVVVEQADFKQGRGTEDHVRAMTRSSDFDEIWYQTAHWELDYSR